MCSLRCLFVLSQSGEIMISKRFPTVEKRARLQESSLTPIPSDVEFSEAVRFSREKNDVVVRLDPFTNLSKQFKKFVLSSSATEQHHKTSEFPVLSLPITASRNLRPLMLLYRKNLYFATIPLATSSSSSTFCLLHEISTLHRRRKRGRVTLASYIYVTVYTPANGNTCDKSMYWFSSPLPPHPPQHININNKTSIVETTFDNTSPHHPSRR